MAEPVQLEIRRKSGEVVTVEAFPTKCPALVVHESIEPDADDGWVITHERSGRMLGHWPHSSKIAALRIAAHLEGAALDWNFDAGTRPEGEALQPYIDAYQAALDMAARAADPLNAAKGVPTDGL